MCRTKGSTNVQVLIYGIFLLGIHQEDLGCSSTTTANHYLEIAEVFLNLLILIYGFLCIVYQVSHKRSYLFTGSYTWDFSFRNTSRRFRMFLNHNSQSLFGECRNMPGVLIYCFYIWVLEYCLRGVTQKVLPIYRFLYMAFSVLSTRCHTKGPTNLQVLIYGIFLLGIHQEDF